MKATNLAEAYDRLREPFPIEAIELKPQATTGKRAMAATYSDTRVYQERLDLVVGPDNWSDRIIPWGDTRLICEVTIFGVTKSSTGEPQGKVTDRNAGTIAEAQAFKRACSAFNLGRFLYNLPSGWYDYDKDRRIDGQPAPWGDRAQVLDIISKMYAAAGYTDYLPITNGTHAELGALLSVLATKVSSEQLRRDMFDATGVNDRKKMTRKMALVYKELLTRQVEELGLGGQLKKKTA